MSSLPPPPPPATQTIVIERRPKAGIVRRLLTVLAIGLVLFAVFSTLLVREAGLPTRLPERYVAGELTGAKIAIVEVEGLIYDREVEHALRQLRQARDDDTVKAVVLRIDSPGGTVSGSDRIWREVEMLKRSGKPVVASLGGMAASGGYYVAAPADQVIAEPTTLTGSIGVITELPNLEGLLDKLGIEMQTIATGKWKDSGSLFRPMTDEERQRWKAMLDEAYGRFVRIVARGRRLGPSEVESLADGRLYTAEEALKLKLVDALGYLDDAILAAQRRAKLETARVVRYAQPFDWTEALRPFSRGGTGPALDPETLLRLQVPRILYLVR
jgi:protease-4